MRHPRSLAKLVTVVAVASAPTCKTWQPLRVPEPGLAPTEVAEQARITLKDGTLFALRDVVVRGDSLIGTNALPPGNRIAVAIKDVERAEGKRVNALLTAANIGGGIVAGAIALYALALLLLGAAGN